MSGVANAVFLVQARVIKLQTDDGAMSLTDSLKVGDTFIIDLATKSPVPMSSGDRVYIQTVVQCVEDGKWLPWECLEVKA